MTSVSDTLDSAQSTQIQWRCQVAVQRKILFAKKFCRPKNSSNLCLHNCVNADHVRFAGEVERSFKNLYQRLRVKLDGKVAFRFRIKKRFSKKHRKIMHKGNFAPEYKLSTTSSIE